MMLLRYDENEVMVNFKPGDYSDKVKRNLIVSYLTRHLGFVILTGFVFLKFKNEKKKCKNYNCHFYSIMESRRLRNVVVLFR